MGAIFKLPNELEIKGMLGMLYDGVEIKPSDPIDLALLDLQFGVYVDDEDKPVTLAVCDIKFAVYSSCSLTMLPPPVAEEAVNKSALEDAMLSNLNEVFNIISRLYMGNDSPHLRFDKAYSASSCPDDVSQLVDQCEIRVDFEITIPRYGAGRLAMMAL